MISQLFNALRFSNLQQFIFLFTLITVSSICGAQVEFAFKGRNKVCESSRKGALNSNIQSVYSDYIKDTEKLFHAKCTEVKLDKCLNTKCDLRDLNSCIEGDYFASEKYTMKGKIMCCSLNYKGIGTLFLTEAYVRDGEFQGHQTRVDMSERSFDLAKEICN